MKLKASVKHFLFVVVSMVWVGGFLVETGATDPPVDVDPWTAYGTALTIFLIGIRLLTFLAVPQSLFNIIGLFRYCCIANLIMNVPIS